MKFIESDAPAGRRSPVPATPAREAEPAEPRQRSSATRKKINIYEILIHDHPINKYHMKSLVDAVNPIQKINITRELLVEDGPFPNNGLLPLLHYQQAFQLSPENDVEVIKELLETNGWTNTWVDSIYEEHHYHSTAHEVLIALRGSARVQFGGPNGVALTFEAGDVVIIPAGVAHMKLEEVDNFSCLGAYPDGQEYDMKYGKIGERRQADANIKSLPLPQSDPLYGNDGPLIKNWVSEREQRQTEL